MQERNKELAKNTVILGIGQLVPKVLALAVLPILTTYLVEEDYGVYDLILSFASLLIPLITAQIQQAVFRYLLCSKIDEDKNLYITSAILYTLVSSFFFTPIIFIVLIFFNIETWKAILICLLFFSESIYSLFGQILRGLGHNMKYSISVIIYAVANLFLLVLFVIQFQLGLYGVILSLTIAFIISNLYMFFSEKLYKHITLNSKLKSYLKELLAFSFPIIPSSISLWIVNLSDRMLIINFLGNAANGIYAVSNKIPTIYNTAYSVFNLSWTETASKVSDDGKPDNYYSQLFSILFKFLIGAMLFMIAITPLVFLILVKGNYYSAIYQVPILYFGAFFNSFVNYYSGIYIALKRTKQVGISSGIGAILNLAINFLLIDHIGLYAASLSTAISFFMIAIYRAYDLNKVVKIEYNIGEIILGIVLFIISSILLYFNNFITIVICFAIAIIYNTIFNKTFVLQLIRVLKSKLNK